MELIYYIVGFFVALFVIVLFFLKLTDKNLEKLISSEENFQASHKYVNGISGTGTAIDSENKKIIFIKNKSKTVIDFKDLISIETIINGETLHQTKRGSQVVGGVVGGLLLGPAGLLAGALTGKKKVVEKVSKISIKALINSIDTPYYELVFYDDAPIKTDSTLHNIYSELADEWIGRFSAIINISKDE